MIKSLNLIGFSAFVLATIPVIPAVHAQSYSTPITTRCLNQANEALDEMFPGGAPDFSNDRAGWDRYTSAYRAAIDVCMTNGESPAGQAPLHPGSSTLPPAGGTWNCPAPCYSSW